MSEMTYVNLLRRQRFICLLRITSLATANTIDLLQDPGNKTSSFPQTQPKMIPWGRRAVWKLHWSEEIERPVILWNTALGSSCHYRHPSWTSGSSSLCFYPITSSKEEIKLVLAWNKSNVPLSGLIYLSLLQNAPSVRMPSSTNMYFNKLLSLTIRTGPQALLWSGCGFYFHSFHVCPFLSDGFSCFSDNLHAEGISPNKGLRALTEFGFVSRLHG